MRVRPSTLPRDLDMAETTVFRTSFFAVKAPFYRFFTPFWTLLAGGGPVEPDSIWDKKIVRSHASTLSLGMGAGWLLERARGAAEA